MKLRIPGLIFVLIAVIGVALCRRVAAFSEQTLPAKETATPAAAPSTVSSPVPDNSTSANVDWQQVPAPAASESAGAPVTGNPANGITPTSVTVPRDNSPPPALDVSTIGTGLDPIQTPLAAEIKQADNPALAASLRQTEQARRELADGKLDEAMRSLGPAVSIDAGNPYAYFYLGRVYMERKNYDQALIFFKRAEINFRGNSEWLGATLSNEGICYEEMNRMSEAASAYRSALAAAPNNLIARAGSGRLGDEYPDPNTAANPATSPEGIGSAAASEIPPPPEEAQPPPPPPDGPDDDSSNNAAQSGHSQ